MLWYMRGREAMLTMDKRYEWPTNRWRRHELGYRAVRIDI